MAREAIENGHALAMHLCGRPYPDKPPLFFWIVGAFGWLGSWSVFVMRMAPLLATAGTAWLVSRMARRWWGHDEALLAPVLFLSTAMALREGARLQIDPVLAFFTTVALHAASASPKTRKEARRRAWIVGAATGLAALTKGPVAWLVVGSVLVAWRVVLGPAPKGARGSGALWIGVLAAILPVASWAAASVLAEPALAEELLFRQHAGRVVNTGSHPGPPWQYLTTVPALLLPWSVPIALGLRAAARHSNRTDAGLVRAGVWFGVLFVIFSLILPKRSIYLLPAYPAAALLGARWIAGALHGARSRTVALLSVPAGLLLAGLGVLALPLVAARDGLEIDRLALRTTAVGVPLVLGALWSARAVRGRTTREWALRTLAPWCLAATLGALLLLPPMNPLRSSRGIALHLATRPERPLEIPCRGVHPEAFRFYAGVPTVHSNDLASALERDGRDFLALVRDRNWSAMDAHERLGMCVHERFLVDSRTILVVGAAPGSGAQPPGGE